MPKVSIVISAYNAERYIAQTLDCIINQTMQDVEIICINDASSDGTLHIIKKFAKKEDQIVIINNENNQGAAICRNIGIERSTGAYICFLDADDVYSLDMIEKEYEAICKYDADIAVVHSIKFKGNIEDGEFQPYINEAQWKEQCISIENSEQTIFGRWNIAPWNKMYKKKFVQEYGLYYQDIPSSNDVFFGMMALLLAEKIVLVKSDKPMVFHRMDTEGQISGRRTPLYAFLAFVKVHDVMVDLAIWEQYFEKYFEHFYKTILSEFNRCKNESVNRQTYMYIAQEGLQRLDFLNTRKDQYRNEVIYQRVCNFFNYSYDGAWFWSYEQILQQNKHKIILKIKGYNISNKSIVIWGAGAKAKAFIAFCQENSCKIHFLVDKDSLKQGRNIHGMKIQEFEDVSSAANVVLVLNSCFYEEIRSSVMEVDSKIEVIDFQRYLST